MPDTHTGKMPRHAKTYNTFNACASITNCSAPSSSPRTVSLTSSVVRITSAIFALSPPVNGANVLTNVLRRMENAARITSLAAHTLVNTVVIEEDISDGEKADEFSVYVYPYPYGKRVLVFKGYTIGHKRICSFPTIRTQKIDIVIDRENAPCKLDDIRLYYVK